MSQILRCAILDDYQNVAFSMADWTPLEGRVRVDRFGEHLGVRRSAVARLAKYDIIVTMHERMVFDAALLRALPRLKLLLTTGTRNAAIDMEAAAALGVAVVGTRGSVGAAAELAWGLLLSVMRNLPAEVANLRAGGGQWQLSVGRGLRGKVLGIAGVGKLGRVVAGYGRAFGMKVMGWSRSNTPERSARLGIAYAGALDVLLQASDVVSLHLPLTPQTRGLIGRREIGQMRPGAVLINTSRGPLVDEAALIEALSEGRLGGAGLDVYDSEPLPLDHPLRHLPNVVATPHLGYVTEETYRLFFADAVEGIVAWLDGEEVRLLNEP